MKTIKTVLMHLAASVAFVAASSVVQADVYWSTGNDGRALVNFDTVTASSNFIGTFTQAGTYGLAFAPDGTAYTLAGSQAILAKVNLANGALTTVGGPGGFFGYALDFANDGTLYAINVGTNGIFSINTGTGAFTFLRNVVGAASQIMDMTFDKAGNLYTVSSNNLVHSINLNTGASFVAFNTVLSSLMGIAAENSGNLIATSYTSQSQFERINVSNGSSAVIGNIGAGGAFAHGGDIRLLASVPEPATAALLGLGLLGLLGWSRRRSNAKYV